MDKQREEFEKCAIAHDYYDLDSAQVGSLENMVGMRLVGVTCRQNRYHFLRAKIHGHLLTGYRARTQLSRSSHD